MSSQAIEEFRPRENEEDQLDHTVEEVICYQVSFQHKGKAIGRAQLHSSSSHILEVVDLFVEPEYRGNGHARRILDTLIDFARKLGAKEISAHASPDNTAAYRVFKQLGFNVCHNEVHMERPV